MRDSSIAKMARPWERAGCHLISLLLGGLILVPPPATAQENLIPFYVSSKASEEVCLFCEGPWLRSSPEPLVPPGTVNLNFYTAEITIFSPFGHWTCWVVDLPPVDPLSVDSPNGACDFPSFDSVDFCVAGPAPAQEEVDLTVEPDLSITVLGWGPPPCNSTAAAAFLGDATPAGRLDRDAFRFDGEAGETITGMLERDGARGSTGEIAELTLRGKRGPALDAQSGALPLELTVTLPETGSYEIEASEVGTSARGSASPFRGHYLLTVTSTSGEPLLEPAESTEP